MIDQCFYTDRTEQLQRISHCLTPEFPFKPIEINSRDLLLTYQPSTTVSCRSFLSLYAYSREDDILYWEDKALGWLCLMYIDKDNHPRAYPPLGELDDERFAKAIDKMARMFELLDEPMRISYIEEAERAQYEGLSGYRVLFSSDRDEEDYVYETAALTNFEGHENYNRRMNYNKFRRRHEIKVVLINRDNVKDCEKVMEGWCHNRECQTCAYRCPRHTSERALNHLDSLHAVGSLMYMDGQPQAMILLGRMSDDMADLLTIFSESRLPGLTYCLLDETCRLCLPGMRYLNIEEDMGLENLRKFKQSLHPCMMMPKYAALLERT